MIGTPLFVTSGDLIADRRYQLAMELHERGDLAAAADVLLQTVERVPGFTTAWFALALVREQLGDCAAAISAFEKALAGDPEDRQGARLHLARLGAGLPDTTALRGYVRQLFDQQAARFDVALRQKLNYRGPELLFTAMETACRDNGRRMHFTRMLDLGCGTGLVGEPFRPCVNFLAGVDLSPRMIDEARGKDVYDDLAVADIEAHLATTRTPGTRYDLIVAADVFVYFSDLVPVITAIAAALAREGLFAFTVETHDGAGALLRDTLRYAQSPEQVRIAVAQAGLQLLQLAPAIIRTEKGEPVRGLVAVAKSAASTLPHPEATSSS